MKECSPATHTACLKLRYCDYIYHHHLHRRHCHHHLLATRLWIQHCKKQEPKYYFIIIIKLLKLPIFCKGDRHFATLFFINIWFF